jgi:hypothetical protein
MRGASRARISESDVSAPAFAAPPAWCRDAGSATLSTIVFQLSQCAH